MGGDLAKLFAARVREEALERGLSVNMLADFAGLARGFVSQLLRGEKGASLDTVEKIAAALDLEPWQLLVPRFERVQVAETPESGYGREAASRALVRRRRTRRRPRSRA